MSLEQSQRLTTEGQGAHPLPDIYGIARRRNWHKKDRVREELAPARGT